MADWASMTNSVAERITLVEVKNMFSGTGTGTRKHNEAKSPLFRAHCETTMVKGQGEI